MPITTAELTGDYTIDTAHSRVGFVARHAMVTKVRGAFNEWEGSAHIDGANPANSWARVTIQAHSIDTRNAQRDEHLRSNDFLAMHPADGRRPTAGNAPEPLDRTVRVWFGHHVIAELTAPAPAASRYAAAMERRFFGLRITNEPAPGPPRPSS
jgi:hypothetical protein